MRLYHPARTMTEVFATRGVLYPQRRRAPATAAFAHAQTDIQGQDPDFYSRPERLRQRRVQHFHRVSRLHRQILNPVLEFEVRSRHPSNVDVIGCISLQHNQQRFIQGIDSRAGR